MITQDALQADTRRQSPRIWGHTPSQIHDLYWSTRGVQVVRQGAAGEYEGRPELFLLIDPSILVLFDLRQAADKLFWTDAHLMTVRTMDIDRRAATGRCDIQFAPSLARIGLTTERRLADVWVRSDSPRHAWGELRRQTSQSRRAVMSLKGFLADCQFEQQTARLVGGIARCWRDPDSRIDNIRQAGARLWVDASAKVNLPASCKSTIWLGRGRTSSIDVVGAAQSVIWDQLQDPAGVDNSQSASTRDSLVRKEARQ